MPTAHLLCGYIGSGKTTFARQLENDTGAARFTHDEWVVERYGHNPPADKFKEYSDHVSSLIWTDALAALSEGRDIVLDFGFWKRAERDEARQKLAAYDVKLYCVVCDLDTAWARVETRNKNLGSNYLLIERHTFEALLQQVEPLGADEDIIIVDSAA